VYCVQTCLTKESEQDWHHHAIHKDRERARSRLLKQRASILWRKHPCYIVQAEVKQAGGGHNLGAQPDGVDSDIGQIEKRAREVAADERSPRPRLWIEPSDVVIEERQWYPASTHVVGSATVAAIEAPRAYGAVVIAPPGRQEAMLGGGGFVMSALIASGRSASVEHEQPDRERCTTGRGDHLPRHRRSRLDQRQECQFIGCAPGRFRYNERPAVALKPSGVTS
jgi:hypothetical protein